MSEIQTTTLGRNWLIKTLLFLVLLLGFGCWGLVDAVYFYPRRGEMDAARRLKDHLAAADAAGMLTSNQLKVTDPKATYAQLRAREAEIASLARQESPEGRSARFDATRLVWLESLNRMWALRSEPRLVDAEKGPPARKHYFDMREGAGFTVGPDGAKTPLPPGDLLKRLVSAAATSNQVTPLSGFDMLFQWVFVLIGFGGGLWMLVTLLKAAAKRYRWEPAEQRLTMPDGKTVVPSEIGELDKRLWHKFFCVMNLKDGGSYKLDLLRYQPLEDWVLAMERTAFPDRDTEEGPPDSPEPSERSSASSAT